MLVGVLSCSFCWLTASLHRFERNGEEVEETFVEALVEFGSRGMHSALASRADIRLKLLLLLFKT
jgi:hypothetical protein